MSQDTMPAGLFRVCERSLLSEMALDDHAGEAHGSTEPGEAGSFVCPERRSTFATFAQLRDHRPSHGELPDRPGHAG